MSNAKPIDAMKTMSQCVSVRRCGASAVGAEDTNDLRLRKRRRLSILPAKGQGAAVLLVLILLLTQPAFLGRRFLLVSALGCTCIGALERRRLLPFRAAREQNDACHQQSLNPNS